MKKKTLIIISVIALLVLLFINFTTVIFIGNENVTARYIYGNKNIITELPPNKTLQDKHFVGFYKDKKLVAILDLQ